MTPTSPHPGADLLEVVRVAREREGALLTAGELRVLDRIEGLDPEALELFARLQTRTGEVYRLAALDYALDVPGAIGRLAAAGLVHTQLADDRCRAAFDVPGLQAACRRLGLPTGGRREVIEARLAGRRWVEEAVVAVGHRRLLQRLDRFFFQSSWADRSLLVAERLGAVRWAEYTPTGGPGLFPDRRALRAWERAREGDWTDPGEPLRIALAGPPAAGWSAWRRAVEEVVAQDPDADTLARLLAAGAPVRTALVRRLEKEGRLAEAVRVCTTAVGAEALGLERTGRRLGKKLGWGWPPRPPLEVARERTLVLAPGPVAGSRPTWRVGGEARVVEAAMIALLAEAGRVAIHAENWFWTSLFALVFRDLYFAPVPGMLPTARRTGPLDLGTPGFHRRRVDAVEARLRAVAQDGPAPHVAGWTGERLTGLVDAEGVRRRADRVPGPMAACVLGRLARDGWDAARGLPDLLIFSGPTARVEGAVPSTLEEGAFLAEVKGPGDSLRDEQRVWIDHLRRAGVSVELWILRA